MLLFVIFFIKSLIIFGFVLEFIFKVKVLLEDLLASLMVRQVSVLCCLPFFRFFDEGVCFEFPEGYLTFSYVFARLCVMSSGKRQMTEGIELPNQGKIRILGEKENHKCLGILEADTIKQVDMKEKI